MSAVAQQLRTAQGRRRIFVALAFLLQGLWAGYVAWDHGLILSLRAGFLHGLLCAGMTIISTLLMDTLFNLVARPWLGFLLAVTGTCVVMLGGAVVVHLINGTPDILVTITPLILLGVPFYIFYSYLIYRSATQYGESQ